MNKTLDGIPEGKPLLITIEGRAVRVAMTLPASANILSLMGEFEWCEWPQMTTHNTETQNG